ncbi:hypothetical protein R5R35_013004 [Gryllus longicercus]|uniref:Tyrosinase copper-binding domain-containing protein n=1 Tax=Gryllus longicercus TaxID=2509291 RepID=A0AAN9V5N4_9ORTH
METMRVLVLLAWAAVLVAAQRRDEISNRGNLQYLFDRPVEPIYYAKGENEDVIFRVPDDYVPRRYQSKANELTNRFGDSTQINVPRINVPDISLPMQLGRRDQFSLFIPYHRRMARRLVEILLGMRSYEDFVSAGVFCRERINPFLFSYAMSIAILHRNDTQGAQLPLFASRFPEKFFDGSIFSKAREEANLVNTGERIPLEIPLDYTATNLEPEHRVAYFREDVGINLCHWHWHLVYPFSGPPAVVRKDRRGELFYYFHQQIIARYNFERFSNRLGRVQRLLNWRDPIEEGYFPKLDSLVSSRVWPPRHAGAKLSDINREDMQITFDIQDLERWRDRIYEAIHSGRVQAENGQSMQLDARAGIDILGNMIEASAISVNPNLYGDMHNLGHVAIALCHDPDHRHLETFSVMGDSTTAMRDPVFYRWHAMIDDIFQEHKRTLAPYTVQELAFDGIQVTGAEVQTDGARGSNEFNTFWQQSDIDLSRGLDFAPRGSVFVRITHLQHSPFSYRIQVQNSGAARTGTVRIFMAPRFDERGTPLTFREQRLFFIEMDKFQFNFQPGANTIQRLSTQSSLTIPYERTFRDLNTIPTEAGDAQDQFNYCGCGWPQHMLVPKGSQEGLQADLFVMVSNFADDRVDQPTAAQSTCTAGHSYCGIFRQNFPDRRPMGYPFDRNPRQGATTLNQFLTPNMIVTPVTIRFSEQIRQPGNSTVRRTRFAMK